jgi:hypothetical protein
MKRLLFVVVSIFFVVIGCASSYVNPHSNTGFKVKVQNDWTSILTVAVLPQGPRTHVNPGETRVLYLGPMSTNRQLSVTSGRHSYLSGIFIPSVNQPCWLLVIDTAPRYVVGTGPDPCR